MFDRSAHLYDLIYGQFKDYPAEAAAVAALLREEAPHARTILDVACGTGEHARLLTERHGYEVDGLDLEPAFVEIAARKLPAGRVVRADMAEFELDRRYDVILCLFSAIGYLPSPERTTAALRRFRAHLAPGGLMVVEPWLEPGRMASGRLFVKRAETAEIAVVRMSRTEVDGRISRLTFEYLVGRPATGIERLTEVHELLMLTSGEMMACFAAAGLDARHDPVGLTDRGLFVARAAA